MHYIVQNIATGGSLDVDAPTPREAAAHAAAVIAVGHGNIEARPVNENWWSFELRRSGTDNAWEAFEVIKYPA